MAVAVGADPARLRAYERHTAELARELLREGEALSAFSRRRGSAEPADGVDEALGELLEICSGVLPSLARDLGSLAAVAAEVADGLLRADAGAAATARPMAPRVPPGPSGAHTSRLAQPADALTDIRNFARRGLRLGDAIAREVDVATRFPALRPLIELLEPVARITPLAGLLQVSGDIDHLVALGSPADAWRHDAIGYSEAVLTATTDTTLLVAEVAPSPLTIGLAGTSLAALGEVELWRHGVGIIVPAPFPILVRPNEVRRVERAGQRAVRTARHVVERLLPG